MLEKIQFSYGHFKKKWDENPFFSFVAFFCVIFAIFSLIYLPQSSTPQLDDHFFHFKLAYLLRTEGFNAVKNFEWIKFVEFTKKNEHFPITLYHVTLLPFTYFEDPILGLKLGDIFLGSLSISILYYILRKCRVKYSLFLMLLLISSAYFLQRILLGRSFVLVVSLVFLELYLAVNKKYKTLFFLSLFHVLWHRNTFLLPLIIIFIVETGRYLAENKIYIKNIFTGSAGIILGMSFFSGFPGSLYRWISVLYNTQMVANSGMKGQGNELYKKDPLSMFWGNSEVFFLLAVVSVGIIVYIYYSNLWVSKIDKNYNKDQNYTIAYSVFIFLIVVILGSMIVSGRLYDFYFPALIFLIAFVFAIIAKNNKIIVDKSLSRFISTTLFIYVLFLMANNLINMKINYVAADHKPIENVVKWISNESSDGDQVFLQNWTYFTIAFFYDHKNTYTMGIEPRILYEFSPELYWKWMNIYSYNIYCEEQRDCADEAKIFNEDLGKADENQKREMLKGNGKKIIQSIKNDFDSRFVLSNSSALNQSMAENSELIEKTFESKSEYNGMVFKVFKLK